MVGFLEFLGSEVGFPLVNTQSTGTLGCYIIMTVDFTYFYVFHVFLLSFLNT